MEIQKSSISTEINPQLRVFVKALFEDMLLNFGKKFTDQWGSLDVEKMETHWCISLTGFTPREFKRGLAEMENLSWPPTLPEFKKLCRPPIDFLVAYYEAIAGLEARNKGEVGTWSHPAIFWAAISISYDLVDKKYSEMKVRWEHALKTQLAKGQWSEIPSPALSIEYKKTELSKEKAAQFLQNVGLEKLDKNRTSLAWARDILEHEKNKTRKYPSISIQFAKEALSQQHE